MKKSLVVMLTLIFILGIAGTALAANPFSDVPRGHWAYSAVSKLAAEGIIDGMGDGTFKGDKTLTRYEMATFVARAMTKEAKATPDQRATIDKLANEYKEELKGLGVRIQRLEDGANRIVINGIGRVRYDAQDKGTTYDNKSVNLDLYAAYNIGDGWAVKTESEWNRDLDNPNTTSDNNNTMTRSQCEQLYITNGSGLVVGKYAYKPGYGLTYYAKAQGLQYTFGNTVKTSLNWGHTDAAHDLKAVDVVVPVGAKTNIRGDFEQIKDESIGTNRFYGAGMDTKIGDILLTGAASQIKMSGQDKVSAYLGQIQFKAADIKVPHSSDIFASYSKTPDATFGYTSFNTTTYLTETYSADTRADDDSCNLNFKGTRVGFHYVPMKNTLVTVWYMTGKEVSNNSTDRKVLRAQAEFFF
ncbi:MAG: S-layer protein [Firmicutes bacterium]|nr:S-layer protein [Bacillota bacterium]